MIYTARELLARLKYLILSSDIDDKIEWIGKDEDYKLLEAELNKEI